MQNIEFSNALSTLATSFPHFGQLAGLTEIKKSAVYIQAVSLYEVMLLALTNNKNFSLFSFEEN
jgi:hypothetical protein